MAVAPLQAKNLANMAVGFNYTSEAGENQSLMPNATVYSGQAPVVPRAFAPSPSTSACPRPFGSTVAPQAQAANPSPLIFTNNGIEFTVSFSEFRICRHGHLKIDYKASANAPSHLERVAPRDVDTDAPGSGIGIEVYVHLYTASGEACAAINATDCKVLTRRLPVTYHDRLGALTATFVPDPSSRHYQFTVKVKVCCLCDEPAHSG